MKITLSVSKSGSLPGDASAAFSIAADAIHTALRQIETTRQFHGYLFDYLNNKIGKYDVSIEDE